MLKRQQNRDRLQVIQEPSNQRVPNPNGNAQMLNPNVVQQAGGRGGANLGSDEAEPLMEHQFGSDDDDSGSKALSHLGGLGTFQNIIKGTAKATTIVSEEVAEAVAKNSVAYKQAMGRCFPGEFTPRRSLQNVHGWNPHYRQYD